MSSIQLQTPITIHARSNQSTERSTIGQEEYFRYRIAECDVISNIHAETLAPWKEGSQSIEEVVWPDMQLIGAPVLEERLYYMGTVRCVTSYAREDGILLNIEHLGVILIQQSGCSWLEVSDESLSEAWCCEYISGPPLLLQLAFRGLFSLHASAAMIDGVGCLFLAESGKGKSTMVSQHSQIDKELKSNWIRLADDISVIRSIGNEIYITPSFPQLKLDIESNQSLANHDPVRIEEVFIIDEYTNTTSSALIELLDLSITEKILQVSRHTVGIRIFNSLLARNNMQHISRSIQATNIQRLRYPREMSLLTKVRDALSESVLEKRSGK